MHVKNFDRNLSPKYCFSYPSPVSSTAYVMMWLLPPTEGLLPSPNGQVLLHVCYWHMNYVTVLGEWQFLNQFFWLPILDRFNNICNCSCWPMNYRIPYVWHAVASSFAISPQWTLYMLVGNFRHFGNKLVSYGFCITGIVVIFRRR